MYKLKFLMRLKYLFHLSLYFLYKFDSWHISPIESREYCLDTVKYVGSKIQIDDCVIEIGCGLGETLQAIDCKRKIGYDVSENVIKAAKFRNLFNSTVFKVGSFYSLNNYSIQYLITLNFLHDFDTKTVSKWFCDLNDNNYIEYIIVDELLDPEYSNNHIFSNLLPTNFSFVKSLGGEYRYNRSIKLFKNNTNN
jgi:hypothetical protein